MTCRNWLVLIMLMANDGMAATDPVQWDKPSAPPGSPVTQQRSALPCSGRFLRLWWYEPGLENGNPGTNRRFRVNSPEVVIHPIFAIRPEAKSSGMLQLRMHEDLRLLQGAELYLELWGGHPGTTNRRVTVNGRTTYALPGIAGDTQCTHMYPRLALKVNDLVDGYNALQFACDQGTSFWGHFIVDEACLRRPQRRPPRPQGDGLVRFPCLGPRHSVAHGCRDYRFGNRWRRRQTRHDRIGGI